MKNAVILCAGSARRFYADGAGRPKCLLPLSNNTTILDGLLRPLLTRGYQIVLGTGCGNDEVVAHSREYSGVECVFNPEFATTNSIVTLWKLRNYVSDETLLINGDLVVAENVFDLFTAEPAPQILTKFIPVFDDDTYRVVLDNEYSVLRMGKDISDEPSASCSAFTGISRVGCSGLFLDEVAKLLQSGTRDTWPTTAYRNLIGRRTVRAHDIGDAEYFDVDTPEEHQAAQASSLNAPRSLSS